MNTGFMFPNSKGETKRVVLSWRDAHNYNHDFMPSVFESILDKIMYWCEEEDLMEFADFIKFVDEHIAEIKEDSRALGEKFEGMVNRYKKIMALPTKVPENIIGWYEYKFLESGCFDIRFEMKGPSKCLCYILSDTADKERYWSSEGRCGVQVLEFRCEPVEEKPTVNQTLPQGIDFGALDHAGTWGDDDGLSWDD